MLLLFFEIIYYKEIDCFEVDRFEDFEINKCFVLYIKMYIKIKY